MIVVCMVSQKRFEYKFICERAIAYEFLRLLGGTFQIDSLCDPKNGYINVSCYFDTLNGKFYREKIEGDKNRIKPRIRSHVSQNGELRVDHFLELKTRSSTETNKYRKKITSNIRSKLLRLEPVANFSNDFVLAKFFDLDTHFCLSHSVSVAYKRFAYASGLFRNVRITIDSQTSASNTKAWDPRKTNDWLPVLPITSVVLEVKVNGQLPNFIYQCLQELNLNHQTFSKYSSSIEVLNSRIMDAVVCDQNLLYRTRF